MLEAQPSESPREDLDEILTKRRTATDSALQDHLDRIIAGCLTALPDARALILYGSYGRGEGAWFEDDDGSFRPYNDYDVLIVADRTLPKRELDELKQGLLREIGLRWLDVGQKSPAQLRRLRPSILNHDLKYASRVIHGDTAVLDLIPDIPASSLPMKDAQILYFTRLWTFLGSLPPGGVDQDLAGDCARFFRNQMSKAVLAVVDVVLLAHGAYDTSYRTRVERLAALHPEEAALLKLSSWALREKLVPRAPVMNASEVCDLYAAVLQQYRRQMYRALGHHFGRPIRGPEDLERALRWRPVSLLRRAFWLARFRGRLMEKRLDIQLAQSYLVAAYGDDARSEPRLARATRLLRSLDHALPAALSWNDARVAAAKLRMEL